MGPEAEDHLRGEINKAQSNTDSGIFPTEFFNDQDIFSDPVTLASIFLGKVNAYEPQFTGLLPELLGKGVVLLPLQDLLLVELPLGEFPNTLLNVLLLSCQFKIHLQPQFGVTSSEFGENRHEN